ncbi:MAG: rRNA maturation RNase YbeY [Deltaproteobacteria bacterium]|nr:rRNA maturation RNase YbeY [Deltaproteobacteria bacterium]
MDKPSLKSRIKKILSALVSDPVELSVLLVDDRTIAELNSQYLNRRRPTNVLSFPMREGPFSEDQPEILGDVVISVETASREAEDSGITVGERLDFLLIHGILHLFGYDHEEDESEARIMEEKTEELMTLLRSEAPLPSS